jgi:hypothetical protein
MADNIFTKYGGKIQFTPERVQSNDADFEYQDADQIRNIALQRDLTAANLLENDILLDALDAAIDDQMKEFALTVPELYDAASNLCGSPTVTWECYKKAKELLKIAPWIAYGYDPVQLTFTDKLTKRAGNVVFDCKKFDPDLFQKDGFDPMKAVDDEFDTETPSEIEKRATENQKKWALLVLFWDLLWGKPAVKPNIIDADASKKNIDEITAEINQLQAESQDTTIDPATQKPKFTDEEKKAKANQAKILGKSLGQEGNLPNTIMLDRPLVADHLQWQGKSDIIPHITKSGQKEVRKKGESADLPWVADALTIWADFGSFFTTYDRYKDRGVPALKSGFILSILVGFCSLPPKIGFFFIEKRIEFLKSIRVVKKVPIVGKPLFDLFKGIINLIVAGPVVFSNIFIEICIWLCLQPKGTLPNVSDEVSLPDTASTVTDRMDVEPTPAGFVSMDCFVAAQEIVNRVHIESVN